MEPGLASRTGSRLLLSALPSHNALLSERAQGRDMQACFAAAPGLPGVVIVSPTGILRGFVSRRQFMELFSKPYRVELYSDRRVASLLREVHVAPLVFPADAPIDQAASAMVRRPPAEFSEPVVLRLGKGEFRIVDSQALLSALVQNFAEQYRQLQTAKDAMVESEKLASLGSLVAGVAHEVNTPLGIGIMAMSTLNDQAQALQKRVDSGAIKRSEMTLALSELQDLSATALRSLNKAAELVRSFKQVSADQVSEARREFALDEELRHIVVSLRHLTKRPGVTLTLAECGGIRMNSFPGALSQVVTIFVVNAYNHAFEGRESGAVTICCDEEGEVGVTIRVCDDGSGIPADHLERIFDPFFTTKRGSGGTGLGLSIAYNLARTSLGGLVTVRSAPGGGACFSLAIPRVAPVHPASPS